MKKIPVYLFIAICIIFCVSIVASAETLASGACGDNLTWTLDDAGTLTISGTGAMTRYNSTEYPWYSCKDLVVNVIVDNGVTGIEEYAFNGYSRIQSVSFPDTITLIGDYAFHNNTSITELLIPNSVQTIGGVAFAGCTGLKKVVIDNAPLAQ